VALEQDMISKAYDNASLALLKIEAHEKLCEQRWQEVVAQYERVEKALNDNKSMWVRAGFWLIGLLCSIIAFLATKGSFVGQ
jgi:hypothetical protein